MFRWFPFWKRGIQDVDAEGRRRAGQFQVQDRELIDVDKTFEFHSTDDLLKLLPSDLPKVFGTKNDCRTDANRSLGRATNRLHIEKNGSD